MGERKPDRFTITFYNKYELEEEEVRTLFSEFGHIVGLTYINGRFFVRYGNRDEAEEALIRYGEKYQADFARERAERPSGEGGRGGGGRRSDRSDQNGRNDRSDRSDRNDRNDSHNETSRFRRMESNDDSGPGRSEDDFGSYRKALVPATKIPDLVDAATNAAEKFLFVIGNLPPKFTQDDVKLLIEESNPVHVGRIDNTPDENLLFCPIHLDTLDKVSYLHDKLDGFVVGGNKLIAMEASQLLEMAGLT